MRISNSPIALIAACLVAAAHLAPAAQTYEPSWKSLDARPIPAWFDQARFGIMICWGPYSVPSWSPKGSYAEWYGYNAKQKDHPVRAFHLKNYGADFDYRQFGPMLRGELFNPDAWADLFARAGGFTPSEVG